MGVSRSACYDYVRCTDHCSADPCHLETLETIRDLAKSSHHSYGSRRIGKALNARGYPMGRWKARRLMQEAGVQVSYRKEYKITPDSNHKQPVFGNKLNRQIYVARPDQVYVSDITYIWTQEGWQRQPQAGLTVHSDRGSQYACKQYYRQLLKIHGFIGSMSRVGNCWDTQWPRAFSVALNRSKSTGNVT